MVVLGVKATIAASVAVSFGGVVSIATVLTLAEVFMNRSDSKHLGVWCGVALLWRTGLTAPPRTRISADDCDVSPPMRNARGFESPLHTIFGGSLFVSVSFVVACL